jgi:uncharacterized SAM-binding protein YcdF (DUF218 family)
MAAELRARGVPLSAVVLESLSDDTLGNAYAARALHTDWRTDWRRLVLITSDFQARSTDRRVMTALRRPVSLADASR